MINEEDIFAAAAALPADARAAYLDSACGGHPEVRARVEAMLRSHDAPGFMDQATGDVAGAESLPKCENSPAEQTGDRIGRYKLLQQIGEGGFGVVWMAEQIEPVTRRVALKIIKAGMDTKEVIARFEAERQALAMMDHPNIARVFDAGATDKGRPFFVMELVKGIPITRFCDEQQFTTRRRLELFADVCSAISHAHQKGVIHRDIKPSNVMVTLNADRPVVKVIDFGVAKATQGRLTDRTLFTRFEQFVGTPVYMSPEQAAISELDIDTRSDIYALGILLYELLTGMPPFDARSLVSAGYEEMRRIIREVEPVRPSQRLSTVAGDERTALAKARHTAPEELGRLVELDLDWIVMKAIEKDRTRRYETANGFAEDIRRYLANEPVTAVAPSVAYLFRKFARRHRAAFGLTALIAMLLLAAMGVSLWQTKLALVAKKDTTDALGEVEKQKTEVDRKNAEQSAMLVEAARSDRLVAEEHLGAGREREAFAHLARACECDPRSTLAPEKATAALNGWKYPVPTPILTGHEGFVRTMQFSRDGSRIVTASSDKTARVWDAATGKILATLVGHEGGVRGAQFSQDGSRIVTASDDKTARVWEAATGKILATIGGLEGKVSSAQFSPDGSRIVTRSGNAAGTGSVTRLWDSVTGKSIATLLADWSAEFSPDSARIVAASPDNTARVWDAATGKILVTLVEHEGRVHTAHFSPDGARIVTASDDKIARVWDAVTGKGLATLAGSGAQFSPDGSRIVTASDDNTARVWDAATGKSLVTLAGHEGRVSSAQFSRDGSHIVTVSRDNTVRVWDAATGKCLATLSGPDKNVRDAQVSPDGSLIVTTSRGDVPTMGRYESARVWDAATGKSLATLSEHENLVMSAQFSPDGSHIVAASSDHTVRVWDAATGKGPTTLAGHESRVSSAQFSPDGSRIVTASYKDQDRTVRVWDSFSGKSLATLEGWEPHFSPDSARIVAASPDNTARVWDAATGKSLATLVGHEGGVHTAQFSRDGSRIVTASDDKTARVWDAATGKSLATLAGRADHARFSPDGLRVVTVAYSTARVWDAATGKSLATLAGPDNMVCDVQFSRDGRRIVTASGDGKAGVWDSVTGKCLATFTGHDDQVMTAQFSPDGSRIVTASFDDTARVWDSVTGKNLATLAGHKVGGSAQFSPDGSRIVTPSDNKTARVWDSITGKIIGTLAGHEGHVTSAQFSPDGSRIVTGSSDKTARVWTVLPPGAGAPPEWFANFLRYLAQMHLNSDGETETLKTADWLALRERMRAVRRAGAGQDTPYLRILRRYVTE